MPEFGRYTRVGVLTLKTREHYCGQPVLGQMPGRQNASAERRYSYGRLSVTSSPGRGRHPAGADLVVGIHALLGEGSTAVGPESRMKMRP